MNNIPKNLYWATPAQNGADTARHGRTMRGTLNVHSKLNESDIPTIRQRHKDGETQRALAKEYGCSQCNIHNITSRKVWKHV